MSPPPERPRLGTVALDTDDVAREATFWRGFGLEVMWESEDFVSNQIPEP